MYCSGCGQPLAPNQAVCAYCGKPAVQTVPMGAAGGYPLYNRVERHVQTLAILWLVYSLVVVLAFLVAMPFLGFIFGHAGRGFGNPHDFPFPMSMHWLLPLATIVIYARAALGAVVGIGLLRRDRWARVLGIVVGILTLIRFPLGTALGIYTLWVLAPARSGQEYDAIAAP